MINQPPGDHKPLYKCFVYIITKLFNKYQLQKYILTKVTTDCLQYKKRKFQNHKKERKRTKLFLSLTRPIY